MKRYTLAVAIVFLIFQMGSASTEKSPGQVVAYRQKARITERTDTTTAYLPLVFRQYTQPLDLELAGQIGGHVPAMAVQGSYAYVGIGPRLIVFDVSDPSQPIQIGQTDVLLGSINTVTTNGNYVYVGSSGRLGVVDVSTPNDPREVASIVFPGVLTPELSYYPVSDVAVVGNYAYVAVELGGLRIIDLSIPTAPLEVGVYTATVSTGFVGVTVVGNYAYFANGVAGVRVIDISTPSAPIEIGYYEAFDMVAYDVLVMGDYAYVAGKDEGWYGALGLLVFDISTPSLPVKVAVQPLSGYPHHVAGSDNYIYVAQGYDGLGILDISIPTAPVEVGSFGEVTWTNSVVVTGNLAYISDQNGWQVISVVSPISPTQVSHDTVMGGVLGVDVKGNYAYVAACADGGLQIVDIATPNLLTRVGAYDTPGCAQEVSVKDSYAYVADFAGGLRVIDVSTPGTPIEVGYYLTPLPARYVTVAGNYAYVMASDLWIIDISVPSNPMSVGWYSLAGDAATSVVVSGTYAYVGVAQYSTGELRVLDISNPSAPTLITSYSVPSEIRGITARDNYLFTAGYTGSFRVYDLSNPIIPVEVSTSETFGLFDGLALGTHYAFGVGSPGLWIFDISMPGRPGGAGFYHLPDYAWDITVADDRIYVADADGGLLIFEPSAGLYNQ